MQTKEEILLKMGLPLEGENVLNPLTVKPGDLIQGLKVVEIQAFQGTPDYDLDTVLVEFSGSITLTGTVKYLPEDRNFGSDQMVVFEVNALEERNLPVSHHDRWEQTIMFRNREEVSSSLQIKSGDVRENVTILLEDYKYAFLPTDAISTADFVRIIDEK
ncbi:hypothetical protein E5161_20520 [Cohnella pontilimi]|uniref:Uncharacterized protein n=1 Tax=Cohnella pontilimi TaxID=2564100 RepID=A0A4U0F4G4_9BACL|nr:hypothetical protein [Cohnella pontilimi]TJY37672.1 hypothetical protein E5161_20520 [Cohnella pontilimi]